MPNSFHQDLTLTDIHSLVAATYADITARDADTDFQVSANIDKMVRVNSPVRYYFLESVGPPVYQETGTEGLNELIELTDTPSSYSSEGGNVLQVNAGEDAVEFGQALGTTDSPTFSQVSVGDTGLVVGASTPFSDSTGTLTLQNVDIIDASTEVAIETAIDTLPNLLTIQGQTVTFSSSLTVELASTINQDLTTDADPTFNDISVTGLVDGRDVATDGGKLDGIEALADVTDETNVVSSLDGATLSDIGTPASGDKILLQDLSDSDNLKTVDFSVFVGGGDVVGPAGAIDNSVPTYDSTTGKLIQDPNSMFIVSGSVGIGVVPDSSTVLQLTSASKGFRTSIMTDAEADSIASPTDGLLIVNSTDDDLNVFFGGTKEAISTHPTTENNIHTGSTVVFSVTGGTNLNVTGTAADPVVNLDDTITGSGTGGDLTLSGATNSPTGGDINFNGGSGGNNGGSLKFTTGTGSNNAGDFEFVASESPNSEGGKFTFTAGLGAPDDGSGAGGGFTFNGGTGGFTSGDGGGFNFNTGSVDGGSGESGSFIVNIGADGGGGVGNIILAPTGGNVGIGVTDPDADLEINGQIKITGGVPGVDKVLTSDASGLATWEDNIGAETFAETLALGNTTGGTDLVMTTGDILDAERVTLDTLEFVDGSTQNTGAPPLDINWSLAALTQTRVNDLSAETTTQRGLHISPNGLKLYVADVVTQAAFEYDLAAPWDTATAPSYTGNSIVLGVNMTGFFLKDDGTVAYFLLFGGDFTEYPLSTPFDLSTAGSSTTTLTTETVTTSARIYNGGTDLFFTQETGTITHWTMSTPWDLSTLVDTGDSFVTGISMSSGGSIAFRGDGRKLLLVASQGAVFQEYSLDTPWDITSLRLVRSIDSPVNSTSEMVTNPQGDKMFTMASSSNQNLYEYDLSIHPTILSYENSPTVIENIQDNAVRTAESGHISTGQFIAVVEDTALPAPLLSMDFSYNGLKYFMAGNDPNINVYNMSVPFDITSGVLEANNSFNAGFSIQSMGISTNGLNVITIQGGGIVRFWTLGSPFDFDDSTQGVSISPIQPTDTLVSCSSSADGRFFYIHDGDGNIFQYSRRNWEDQSLTYTGNVFNVGSTSTLQCSTISGDGKILYVNRGAADLREYTLTTPWDVSTAILIDTDNSFFDNSVIREIVVIGNASRIYAGSTDINNGDMGEYSLGLVTPDINGVEEILKIDGLTASRISTTLVEVFAESDISDLATANVITIAAGEILTLDIKTDSTIFTFVDFVFEGGTSELRITSDHENASIVSLSTGTFLSGSASRVSMFNLTMAGGSTGTFTDLSDATLNLTACIIAGWDDLGSMNASFFGKGLAIFDCQIADCDVGWNTTNCSIGMINTTIVLTGMTGPLFIVNPNTNDIILSLLVVGFLFPTGSVIKVDPAISSSTRMTIASSNILSGNLFDTTGGATGTFTVVADSSVASTGIDSVTDSSGVARFNFTVGPTMHINQEVVISGFVTNTSYNGTFLITATGAGFFEVVTVAFGSDEAVGSFTSDSVTVTSTSHGLGNGQSLVIDSDLSTDYDGGAITYQAATNNFRINRTFTATQSGGWDTSPIDQTDERIIASVNPGFVDSKYIATAFVNDNSTANGAIVNNTFTDMVFGTGGSALIPGSTIERWKLVDELNGTFEYTGNEPFDGLITFDFTVISSGGVQDFRFKWEIDEGGGFGDLDDNVEALVNVGGDSVSITKTFPLRCVKGCQIKPQITRNAGSSGITTSYATIYSTQ